MVIEPQWTTNINSGICQTKQWHTKRHKFSNSLPERRIDNLWRHKQFVMLLHIINDSTLTCGLLPYVLISILTKL